MFGVVNLFNSCCEHEFIQMKFTLLGGKGCNIVICYHKYPYVYFHIRIVLYVSQCPWEVCVPGADPLRVQLVQSHLSHNEM